jgi:hypothetical protein
MFSFSIGLIFGQFTRLTQFKMCAGYTALMRTANFQRKFGICCIHDKTFLGLGINDLKDEGP